MNTTRAIAPQATNGIKLAGNQGDACTIIGENSRVSMRSDDLYLILEEILTTKAKHKAGRALVKGVIDMNPSTARRISKSFLTKWAGKEFIEYALQAGDNY